MAMFFFSHLDLERKNHKGLEKYPAARLRVKPRVNSRRPSC